MLDPHVAFELGSLLAVLGWVGLIVSLFWKTARRILWPAAQILVPAILAVAYIALIAQGIGTEGGGFGSIAGVRALFADDSALAAGWLHYLAFDLFVGSWIVRAGLERAFHPLLLIPCMVLTFLLGPAGLLLFLALRSTFHSPASSEISP